MPATNNEFGTRLAEAFEAFVAAPDPEVASGVLQAEIIAALAEWTNGGISNPQIAVGLSHNLRAWKINLDGWSDWLVGDPDYIWQDDGQPNKQPGQGWYPLYSQNGLRVWVPAPARLVQDFAGIRLKGTVATPDLLPVGGSLNDTYIVGSNLWVWLGETKGWYDAGPFRGPQGEVGPPGPSFNPDALGTLAGRANHDAAPEAFSYLAIDTSMIYFRYGPVGGWSAGFNFVPGPQGPKGDRGEAGYLGAVGVMAERENYDLKPQGFMFAASDTNLIYTRSSPVAGTWTDGIALIDSRATRINISTTASGQLQSVQLPYSLALSDLMIFENGIEQDGDGFVIDEGRTLRFTRPKNRRIRVVSAFSVRGPQGPPAPPTGGTGGGRPWFATIEVQGLGKTVDRTVEVPLNNFPRQDLEVFINGIKQPPSSLNYVGNILTFRESVTTTIMVQSR